MPPACPFLDTQRASRLVLLLPTDTASSQERPCTLSLTASRCHGTSFSPKEREEAFLGLRVLPWDSPDGHHPKLWERAQQTSPRPCCAVQELLDVLRREKLNLEQSVSELQAKVSRLEEQARGMQERERLLMFFPKLHVPAEAQIESKQQAAAPAFSTVGLCLEGLPELAGDPASPSLTGRICTTASVPLTARKGWGHALC